MKYLEELRNEVDAIDEELVRLIAKRLRIVREIARFKVENGIKLLDTQREFKVVEKVKRLSQELGVDPEYIETIFKIIMLLCLREEVRYVEECGSYRCCREDG
jgi:chorismate mutase